MAVLVLGASLARGQEGFRSDKTVTLTGGISATAWHDLDGDGRSELIVLKKNGALEVRDVAASGS
ncbi:MAG TPA: hypothetical protein ENK43_02790, partial [Planctomycetes bacterium]|nr:hypothetical protein [Planctomycetota bacterium]